MASPQKLPRITNDTIRMPRWIRWSVYGVTILFTLTGIVWLIAHFWLRKEGDIEHPIEPWMLRLHGMTVFVGMFMYGSLLRPHITKAWSAKMNRWTGVVVSVVLGALVISGYLLYYAGSEETRPIISIVHWAIGLLLPIWLPIHVWKGRAKLKSADKNLAASTNRQASGSNHGGGVFAHLGDSTPT